MALIREILTNKELIGQTVELKGWLRNKRVSKNVSFLVIHDGSVFETLQVVYKNLENQEEIDQQLVGAAVEVEGEVVEGRNGLEISAVTIKVLGKSAEDYPIQPKKHTYEFLREKAHLRMRTNTFNAVFKVRSILAQQVHKFFMLNNFVYIQTPLITGNDAEGAGELFQVTTTDIPNTPKDFDYKDDFFGKETYLTVTGQLHVEPFTQTFDKVYTFGPTFRAENSNTTRHAAEFWMIEPEMAFTDLNGCIETIEKNIKEVIKETLTLAKSELTFLDGLVEYDLITRLNDVVNKPFAKITYTKAIDILKEATHNGVSFENEVFWGIDLATEHERYLTDEHFKGAVFVTDYPKDFKAFYMRLNDDQKTVAATDLLVPGIGELVGGSQREERIEVLEDLIKEKNLKVEDYSWYLDTRKYGGVKHAGYGIGFERLIMYVTGIENIRDVIAYPRTPKNCDY